MSIDIASISSVDPPWSLGGMALIVAVSLLLSSFAMTQNPLELIVVCVIFLSLAVVGLPVFQRVQAKKRSLEELRKPETPKATPKYTIEGYPIAPRRE